MSFRGSVVGAQQPRVQLVPEGFGTAGDDAIECATLAGLQLDPWQQLVVRNSLLERADGKWAAFEVGLCVPRQNGKGGVIEALELAGLFVFGERVIIHSAHEFATARAAFQRMEELISGKPEFSKRVKRVSRVNGDQGFYFLGGQSLQYRTRTKSGGRGLTGDRVILDEAMILPESAVSALMPTMSAKSMAGNPQLCYFGSAVDQLDHQHGLVFARVRDRALKGTDPSLAYFEWSLDFASPDDVPDDVLADPGSWVATNPALGIRISADHVAKEHRSMVPRSFAVERAGVGDWPAVDADAGSVFDMDTWRSLLDAQSVPKDPVCFFFDVSPDRSRASVSVAGRRDDGLWHVELVDRRHGTDWVVGRVLELAGKFPDSAVGCDGKGPAASLVPAVEKDGVLVERLLAPEMAQACGFLFDAVEQRTVRVAPANELNAAVRGAVQRPLGDAWAWSRKNSGVDITPLVSVTGALWLLSTKVQSEEILVAWA